MKKGDKRAFDRLEARVLVAMGYAKVVTTKAPETK